MRWNGIGSLREGARQSDGGRGEITPYPGRAYIRIDPGIAAYIRIGGYPIFQCRENVSVSLFLDIVNDRRGYWGLPRVQGAL